MERLGNLEVRSTLLVPDNSGLPENQVSPAPPPQTGPPAGPDGGRVPNHPPFPSSLYRKFYGATT